MFPSSFPNRSKPKILYLGDYSPNSPFLQQRFSFSFFFIAERAEFPQIPALHDLRKIDIPRRIMYNKVILIKAILSGNLCKKRR